LYLWHVLRLFLYLLLLRQVTCNRPRDPTLYDWRNWEPRLKLLDTVRYSCKGGYKRTDGATEATCTRDGWSPNPLCQAILSHCVPPPKVTNAVVVTSRQKEYTSGSEATYQCRDQYTIKGVATVTCINGTWEERNFTCTRTYIQMHLKLLQMLYERVQLGVGRITCINGQWEEEKFTCSPTGTYIQKHLKLLQMLYV
uniref:Complement factor H n=1 Tax=Seriola lalandi dorsalis TaxID=1841481 RepID=A0A3B4Y4Y6_SERLL